MHRGFRNTIIPLKSIPAASVLVIENSFSLCIIQSWNLLSVWMNDYFVDTQSGLEAYLATFFGCLDGLLVTTSRLRFVEFPQCLLSIFITLLRACLPIS